LKVLSFFESRQENPFWLSQFSANFNFGAKFGNEVLKIHNL
jgi:hypothetical protein